MSSGPMKTDAKDRMSLTAKALTARAITFSLFGGLILLFTYWNLNRDSGVKPAVWLVQSLPLLALLPGMIRQAHRAYSWLCFVLLVYFILAVQLVFSSIRQTSDYIFLILTVLLFISSMMTSRWLRQLQKSIR